MISVLGSSSHIIVVFLRDVPVADRQSWILSQSDVDVAFILNFFLFRVSLYVSPSICLSLLLLTLFNL